jgi:hypothetical protein
MDVSDPVDTLDKKINSYFNTIKGKVEIIGTNKMDFGRGKIGVQVIFREGK